MLANEEPFFEVFLILLLTFDVWDFQNDVDLIHEIEATLGKQLEKFECKENEALSDITKVRFLGSILALQDS